MKIEIYTDGACIGNPGRSGAGVYMIYGQYKRKIGKYLGYGTNNIAELTAIKIGLESIKNKSLDILIVTDSKYAIGCLTNFKPTKNLDLINSIKKVMKEFKNIEFKWVRGHSGNINNELVDRLANSAAIEGKDYDSGLIEEKSNKEII